MSQPRSQSEPELRRDAAAALAARHDLGPEYDDHVAAGLADRVEALVAYRTAELNRVDDRERAELEQESSGRTQGFVLGIISLGAGIPITAIGATNTDPGLVGVAICWLGIVGVNAAFGLSRRRRR